MNHPRSPLLPPAHEKLLAQWADAARARGFSSATVRVRIHHLRSFGRFLLAQGVADLCRVTPAHIDEWRTHLAVTPSESGLPRRAGTLNNAVVAVKTFYRLLEEDDLIPYDPARRISFVKVPPRLPPPVLSEDETRKLLESVDPSTSRGARDRAMLELVYASGIRVGELCAMDVDDVDLGERLARIRQGKGGKQRVVPFGPIARDQLDNYLRWVRPTFTPRRGERALWLNRWGERIDPDGVRQRLRLYVRALQLGKRLTPHGLRHACATHLLDRQADLRHIQELLGHSSVESTQIYTHVSLKNLKATLERCHPRERRAADPPLTDGKNPHRR